MPRKKTSSTPSRKSKATSVARLRKLGLTTSQAARSGKKPGGSAYALLKKFAPVLENRAAVVKAPAKVARRYKGTFPTTRNRIVVPKSPGETVRLGRAGMIAKRKVVTPGSLPLQIHIPPRIASLSDLPRGPGYRYRVNYGTSRILFQSYELLQEFLAHYSQGHRFNVGFIEVLPPERRRGRARPVEDDEEEDV